ncbi:bifunctional 4-hydroxy-2-oxoglutarate aldolase/2-dehydro-3-deoxy-phosphogluconate aldolase [Agromyces sp. Leaf222]|uniref:bifunctional 4-hydroxy-2-oxoglutarate aldolase/2-dehydro-3-deoxy-phosphogluconate aldolase n=1 Tax=Agromyces sp. Leaf222 TaxID=1735688 RepID=UPI0009EABFBD|nr:bifunctional 4-hydroxy-2-oxoglutarate aldolase/2-dehydro-3-deoxy-phosphogluconate aldolase [Agromyces sp. Leaf222]
MTPEFASASASAAAPVPSIPTDAAVSNAEFDAMFAGRPLMALFRGLGEARSLELARTAWDLGIDMVELPIQSEADVAALAAVAEAGRPEGRLVGAGTVLSTRHVELAAAAGAAFTVSPGFDPAVVRASTAAGMPSLPGVATATEVQAALALGLTWMKAFPASLLGVPWFRAMSGPFPQARFVATGGMDASNARAYLDAGVRTVAVGSALEDPAQLPALAALLA